VDELVQQALTILRGMWHRRWIGLATAWIVAIIGITMAMRIPERHEATARVYVDTQNLLRPLMEGLSIQPNLDQQVALISRTLISRPNIEKLVRMADLDLGLDTQSATAREDQIDSLLKNVQLSGNASTNVYLISYRNPNPEQARKVVQALLTIFVESSLGDKRQDTRVAVKFVDEQIKQYEESLRAAEGRLKDFRLKYLGVGGQAGTDYFAKLSKLSEEIDATRLELRAAEESRDSYKRELAGETPILLNESLPQVQPAVPAIDARLAAQRAELDTMSRRYTEAHPDIVALRKSIRDLETQRNQEVAALVKSNGAAGRPEGSTTERNPVFQALKVSLAEAEANVASSRARLASYESQYAQLRSSAKLVPQVEAELAQLNRDYDIQKKTYESLLVRRQSATIGEGVSDAGGTQFRVIDPPRVSPQPVPPTRLTLLAFAMLVSIAAGIAASFAAAELKPTFHDARSLRIVTQRPAVGMISMLPNETLTRARSRSRWLFASGLSGLVASFVAILALAALMVRTA
jgi:polysaccharide chain length determinant protein (PEP-CTERM system associated)